MSKPDTPPPLPSVKRLPLYLRLLQEMRAREREYISCPHIARDLGLDSTQVRKDLAITGISGQPRIGYPVEALIDAIEEFLGWKNTTDAFLVGAGHMGTALLGFDETQNPGIRIVAAFDKDPAKIGTVIHGREVLDMENLSDLALRMHVHIGIITTPAEPAQEVCNQLILAGVKAVWNFSPTRLDAPPQIVVENVDLRSSLAALSSRLKAIGI